MTLRSIAFVLFVAAPPAVILPAPAGAQPAAAELRCDGDNAAIRLGSRFYSPARYNDLPAEKQKRWQSVPVATDKTCRLTNGDRVVLHAGLSVPDTPYEPIAIASIWINDRKIVSEVEIEPDPFGRHGPYLNSIFLSPGAVEMCTFPEDIDLDTAPLPPTNVKCATKRYDLASVPVDVRALYPTERSLIGTLSVSTTYSRAFCDLFVMRIEENGLRYEIPRVPPSSDLVDQAADGEVLKRTNADRDGPETVISMTRFWNSEDLVTVARSETLSLRGIVRPVLLVRYGRLDERQRTELANAFWQYDPDVNRKTAEALGWHIIGSDGDNAYAEVEAFSMKGESYLLIKADGWAQVSRPNRERQLETICHFQQVRDNF